MDPRFRHQHLEPFDDVGGPGSRLIGVVHGQDGLLHDWGDPIGEIGVRDGLRALARSSSLLDHLGVPPGGFRVGDPAAAVTLDTKDTLDGGGTESLGNLELDERYDPHLVFAEPVIGRRQRHADRFADDHQELERDPDPLAELSERLVGEGGEPLEAGRIDEVERQGAVLDRSGHVVERDPRVIERPRTHLDHARIKLRVHNRVQLALAAQRLGIARA